MGDAVQDENSISENTTTNSSDAGDESQHDNSQQKSDDKSKSSSINTDEMCCLPKLWNQFTHSIREGIRCAVVSLSLIAAKNPYITIVLITIISLGLIIAGVMTNMSVNVDPDELFTPKSTITLQQEEFLDNFDPNEAASVQVQQERGLLVNQQIMQLMDHIQKNNHNDNNHIMMDHHDDHPMITTNKYNNNNNNNNKGVRRPLFHPQTMQLMDNLHNHTKDLFQYNLNHNNNDEDLLHTNNMDRHDPMIITTKQQQYNNNDNGPSSSSLSTNNNNNHKNAQLDWLASSGAVNAHQEDEEDEVKRVLVTMLVHGHGQNVVTVEGMTVLFDAIETIKNSVPACRKKKKPCVTKSALNLWENNRTLYEETVHSNQDVEDKLSSERFPDGIPVDLRSIAGKALVDENGTVAYAASYIALVRIHVHHHKNVFQRNMASKDDASFIDEEGDVIANLLQLREQLNAAGSNYTVEFWTRRAFEDELFRGIEQDLPLLPWLLGIVIVFTCLAFFEWDRFQSKCLLGLGGVLTILLSILSGYGFMFCCGLPVTPMTTMLPFVVLGVGLDDTFIISLAFNRTDENKDPVERMEETMNEVGLSISITTITTTLAFILGLISSIPAIYWLCLYALTTILIDFLYQITFYVALTILDARRVQANRPDCCCICCVGSSSSSWSPSTSRSGQEGEKEDALTSTAPSTSSGSDQGQEVPETEQKNTGSGVVGNQTMHFADKWMVCYAKHLLHPWVKMFVVLFFAVLLGACIFGTTLMEQEFRVSDMTPSDSFIQTFFRSMQDYTTRTTALEIYFRYMDQSDPEVRQLMNSYIDDLVATPAFGEQPSLCWVKEFDKYVDKIFLGRNASNMTFNEQLDGMLDIPEIDVIFGGQIQRDDEGNIQMSQCQIWYGNLDLYDVQSQLDTFHAERQLSMEYAGGNGNPETWSIFTHSQMYYIWELYNIIIQELVLTTLSAAMCVSVVTLFLVPHWTAIMYVFLLIIILYVDLIGTLQFVGVRINAISYIALVISIGLMVDFILHMLIKYYESKYKTREEKVKDALSTMGTSILLGGLSTFIATIPMLFASSMLFQDIFYAFFAVVALSLSHGLIFLPVVLSLTGPEGGLFAHEQKQDEHLEESPL